MEFCRDVFIFTRDLQIVARLTFSIEMKLQISLNNWLNEIKKGTGF